LTRVMPLKLQIYMFKRLFLKWNDDREDNTAEMDNIDWEMTLHPDSPFSENLFFLNERYPEYHWRDWKREIKNRQDDRRREMKENLPKLVARGKIQHEAEFEEEHVSVPESVPKSWNKRKAASGEIHSTEVEIQLFKTSAKGKPYTYGRIQLTVDPNWVGLKAKISVFVPKP
jgi:hypothetical protein